MIDPPIKVIAPGIRSIPNMHPNIYANIASKREIQLTKITERCFYATM